MCVCVCVCVTKHFYVLKNKKILNYFSSSFMKSGIVIPQQKW